MLVKVGETDFVDKVNLVNVSGSETYSTDQSYYFHPTDGDYIGYINGTVISSSGGSGSGSSKWQWRLNEPSSTTIHSYTGTQYLYYDGIIENGNYFQLSSSGASNRSVTIKEMVMYYCKARLYKKGFNGKPSIIKSLGDLGTITIFGVFEGEWIYGPSDHEESVIVTSGGITPPNYVGYLTIKGSNGETYKVGVYK